MGLRITIVDTWSTFAACPSSRVSETPRRRLPRRGHHPRRDRRRQSPRPSLGLMPRVAGNIAYRAIRNQGTIGGSMALADPSADWPACLIALGASVRYRRTQRRARQRVVTSSTVPTARASNRRHHHGFRHSASGTPMWGIAKVARKSGAFADSMVVSSMPTATTLRSRSCSPRRPARVAAAPPPSSDHGAVDEEKCARPSRPISRRNPDADAYQVRCTPRPCCAPSRKPEHDDDDLPRAQRRSPSRRRGSARKPRRLPARPPRSHRNASRLRARRVRRLHRGPRRQADPRPAS